MFGRMTIPLIHIVARKIRTNGCKHWGQKQKPGKKFIDTLVTPKRTDCIVDPINSYHDVSDRFLKESDLPTSGWRGAQSKLVPGLGEEQNYIKELLIKVLQLDIELIHP